MSDVAERFWPKVAIRGTDECWMWTASSFPTGYGSFTGLGECRSHRVAWILTNGPIPDGLHVLHHCDTPPCCNPNHLYVGTHSDNMRDRMDRTGSTRNPFDAETTRRIRELVREDGYRIGFVADVFDVSERKVRAALAERQSI